jgi:hypothetical protein
MSEMENKTNPKPVALPPAMRSSLEQYRKQVWMIKTAEGALASIFGLLVSYLVVLGLDRFMDTPAALRLGLLLEGSIGLLILFPLKLHHWVWNHRRLDQVARLLRQAFPRLGDRLLGIVELVRDANRHVQSRVLVEAAMRQVDAEMKHRDLSAALPRPRHLAWAWAVGLPLALVAFYALWAPEAGRNALLRWLTPWRVVDRYTFAQLEPHVGTRVVPYAEPFELNARLRKASPWKPGQAQARYGRQSPITAPMRQDGYAFTLPPQTEDASVSIRVGDARHSVPVQPRMRPALNALFAEVMLPDYLQRPKLIQEDVRGGSLSLVKGSQVVFKATATRDLAEATLNKEPQSIEGQQLMTRPIRVDNSSEHHLNWRDILGLRAREPQLLKLEAREDEAPNVNFKQFKNHQVVISTEVLRFEILATDDFGVRQVGIAWEGIEDPIQNPEPSNGEKMVAAGSAVTDDLDVPGTFSAQREKVRPQSLKLRAFAEDYLPGRPRAYSSYLVLHVMDPADHFQWLTEQMGQWAKAAQEVYEKELQLHQINQELMKLSPEALQEPGQKQQIQTQAAAEKTNAAKLETLVDIGKELVQDAARNDEFDPDQLDTWAEMLQSLKQISQEQMPSVADLLDQATQAPGPASKEVEEAPLPGEPSQSVEPGKMPGEPPLVGPTAPPGAKSNELEKAEKYGSKATDIQGLDDTIPQDPNAPGSGVDVDRSEKAEGKPGYLPANPTPAVLNQESGFNPPEKAENAPQIKGGLGLPTTLLKGSAQQPEDETEKEPATTSELVLEAVTEQQSLLDAFARLAEEMNQLLMGFENSTFVKRLKSVSRGQMDLASTLNELDGFGLDAGEVDTADTRSRLSGAQVTVSERVQTLQQDMDAYAERRPSEKLSGVLDEMQDSGVVEEVRGSSTIIQRNAVGQSTIEAEFWADTFDRWAEQLVDPLPPSDETPAEGMIELPSLSPQLVLEVLRVINREIELREETRELDQSRAVLEEERFQERARELAKVQADLAVQSRDVVDQIDALPDADHPHLREQVEKVINAARVMDEVTLLLEEPRTGPVTIAAISEVIEILLEAARVPNAPMVVKASPTSMPALMLMGLGDDSTRAFIEERAPNQATGKAGRPLPEEFRQGLDAYMSALENR